MRMTPLPQPKPEMKTEPESKSTATAMDFEDRVYASLTKKKHAAAAKTKATAHASGLAMSKGAKRELSAATAVTHRFSSKRPQSAQPLKKPAAAQRSLPASAASSAVKGEPFTYQVPPLTDEQKAGEIDRKVFTSGHYHKAFSSAKASGVSVPEAKTAGRVAAKQARDMYDEFVS